MVMRGFRLRLCRLVLFPAGATLAATALAGCAMSDDRAARFLVAPDKYVLYRCDQIAAEANKNAARQRELESLMARAGPSSSGQFVSTIAYRPEYLQLRGEMNVLRQTAAEKDCKFAPNPDAASPGQVLKR
jgi:hypothetical protein